MRTLHRPHRSIRRRRPMRRHGWRVGREKKYPQSNPGVGERVLNEKAQSFTGQHESYVADVILDLCSFAHHASAMCSLVASHPFHENRRTETYLAVRHLPALPCRHAIIPPCSTHYRGMCGIPLARCEPSSGPTGGYNRNGEGTRRLVGRHQFASGTNPRSRRQSHRRGDHCISGTRGTGGSPAASASARGGTTRSGAGHDPHPA